MTREKIALTQPPLHRRTHLWFAASLTPIRAGQTPIAAATKRMGASQYQIWPPIFPALFSYFLFIDLAPILLPSRSTS